MLQTNFTLSLWSYYILIQIYMPHKIISFLSKSLLGTLKKVRCTNEIASLKLIRLYGVNFVASYSLCSVHRRSFTTKSHLNYAYSKTPSTAIDRCQLVVRSDVRRFYITDISACRRVPTFISSDVNQVTRCCCRCSCHPPSWSSDKTSSAPAQYIVRIRVGAEGCHGSQLGLNYGIQITKTPSVVGARPPNDCMVEYLNVWRAMAERVHCLCLMFCIIVPVSLL